MPLLPSGRRVEFSLDRFHALLAQKSPAEARLLAESLGAPDDLLPVMDVVYFGSDDRMPFFVGCVASDWSAYAADWSAADRQALLDWFSSHGARENRADAIRYIKALVFGKAGDGVPYPYAVVGTASSMMADGPRGLQ